MSWSATLSWNDGADSVAIGDGSIRNGINATADGIEGWYSTPEGKWSLTEREYHDGAFDVDESQIVYGARTVTLSVFVEGSTRDELVANHLLLLKAAHHLCDLRVADGSHDTTVSGLVEISDSGGRVSESRSEVEITMTCPDPRRYASEGTDGYQLVKLSESSAVTLTPSGTALCYPIVSVTGTLTKIIVNVEQGGEKHTVTYEASMSAATCTLDYRSRRATVGSTDRSVYLTSRGFVGLEPDEEATFTLSVTGSISAATVLLRDTYV